MPDLIESTFLSLDQTRIHEDALASNARQPGYRRLHYSCDGGRGFTELRHRHARVPGRRLARSAATAFGLRRDHVLAEILVSGTTIPTMLSCASSRKAGLSAGLWRVNSVVAQYFATTGP